MFSSKSSTSSNNNMITPHPKVAFLNSIWHFPKIKFFAWKLILPKLLSRDRLRKSSFSINGDCDLCPYEEETIDHLFKTMFWLNLFGLIEM